MHCASGCVRDPPLRSLVCWIQSYARDVASPIASEAQEMVLKNYESRSELPVSVVDKSNVPVP